MTSHDTGSTGTPDTSRVTAPPARTFGPQGPTLGELSDAYLQDYQVRQFRSQSTARGRVAHLVAFFGRDAHAAALTTYQIRQYQLARRAAGAATGTINRETSALHRMCTLAVHWGWLDTVPGFPDRLRRRHPALARALEDVGGADSPEGTFRQQSSKRSTMPRPRWPDSTNSVSDVSGTIHTKKQTSCCSLEPETGAVRPTPGGSTMFRGVVEDARRVGRFGPHFSGPSAEATLQGCSRRFVPRIRQSTALRTGRPTIRPRSTRRCDVVVVLESDRCLDAPGAAGGAGSGDTRISPSRPP